MVGSRDGDHAILAGDERVGAQEDSFDPTEDAVSCSDSEGQAEDGHEGEAGGAAEDAEAEAEVLEHIVLVDVATE